MNRQSERDHADRFVAYDGVYLLSHSIGLPVRGTREAVASVLDTWEEDPADAWTAWLAEIEEFRSSLASLVGTEAAAICPQSNVSSGLAKILGAVASGGSPPTVLLSEDAFPSVGFAVRQAGCSMRFIDRSHDATDPGVWRAHLDADVDVVLITHVHSTTGELIPVREIVALATARGIISIVDVAQSVGVIPIDVARWDADFVIGSCVKWLSGGPGAGWLWARPTSIDRYEPRDVGWFSHADPFEFDIHRFRYADDAMRFWGGTPSVLPFVVARHSVDVIGDFGVEQIRRHNVALGDRLIEELGRRVVSPHDATRRGGTCIVDAPPGTVGRLRDAGIDVDHRANGIRVSPHVHTDPADIEQLLDVL